LPNLLCALDESLRPECVVLVVTPQMQHRASALRRALREHGMRVEDVKVTQAADLVLLDEEIRAGALKYCQRGSTLINLTGGTKPMALSAYRLAQEFGAAVYVEARSLELWWYWPTPNRQHLTSRLSVFDFALAHGYALESLAAADSIPVGFAEVVNLLADEASVREVVWKLALREWARVPESVSPKSRSIHRFFSELEKLGIAARKPREPGTWSIVEHINFLQGGWLEHAVTTIIQEESKKNPNLLYDVRGSTRIQGPSGGNEFDAVFVAGQRLHLVECKASRNGVAMHEIYKHSATSEYLGREVRKILVTLQPLGPSFAQKAAREDIRCFVWENREKFRREFLAMLAS
jgi:hypothetical protein